MEKFLHRALFNCETLNAKYRGVRIMVYGLFDHLLLVSVHPKVFPLWVKRPNFLSIVLHTHGSMVLRATEDIINSHGTSKSLLPSLTSFGYA